MSFAPQNLPIDPQGRHHPLRRAPSLAPRAQDRPSPAVLYIVLVPISAALGAALAFSGLL